MAKFLYPDFYARHLSGADRCLLRCSWVVRAFGGKQVADRGAPDLLQAATQLHVNLGWVVQIHNTAEALPNLINPFWMLPLLGLLNVPARQLIGDAALQLIVNLPLVLLILWVPARTLPYRPPHFP